MPRRMWAYLIISAVMLLSGCAQLNSPPSAAEQAALANRPPRASVTHFVLAGRISVRQGEKRHIAHIDWQHEPDQDRLLLTTPLGQGLAELTRDAQGAHLRLADQRDYSAADMQELAQRLFDIRLPLARLPLWITAQVAPATAENQDDALARPLWRQIEGWRITYRDYESSAAHALPSLIEMQHAADDIDVRLKIDQWQLQEQQP